MEHMNAYTIRYIVVLPFRRIVKAALWLISQIPGTTFGEVAEMSIGPCPRCVGRAIRGPGE